MEAFDREVLAAIAGDVQVVVDEIIAEARAQFERSTKEVRGDDGQRNLEAIEREQARLTDAIAAGAEAPALVARLKATETRRRELVAALDEAPQACSPPWSEIERRMHKSLRDWRSLLQGDVPEIRQAFRELLRSPIYFTPFVENGRRGIRFEGRLGLDAILGGELVTKMASPTGFEPVFWP